MTNPSIAEMLGALAPGERRVYPPTVPSDDNQERFFEVRTLGLDIPSLHCPGLALLDREPFAGNRNRPHVGLDVASHYFADLDGRKAEIGDFYTTDSDLYFISPRLVELIESFDAGAIVHRPARIIARDGEITFRAAMPARVLEAVDADRTEVTVTSRVLPSGAIIRKASFQADVIFRSDIPGDVHAFTDPDLYFWHWSGSLLQAAQANGMRGIYANSMVRARPRWIWM